MMSPKIEMEPEDTDSTETEEESALSVEHLVEALKHATGNQPYVKPGIYEIMVNPSSKAKHPQVLRFVLGPTGTACEYCNGTGRQDLGSP